MKLLRCLIHVELFAAACLVNLHAANPLPNGNDPVVPNGQGPQTGPPNTSGGYGLSNSPAGAQAAALLAGPGGYGLSNPQAAAQAAALLAGPSGYGISDATAATQARAMLSGAGGYNPPSGTELADLTGDAPAPTQLDASYQPSTGGGPTTPRLQIGVPVITKRTKPRKPVNPSAFDTTDVLKSIDITRYTYRGQTVSPEKATLPVMDLSDQISMSKPECLVYLHCLVPKRPPTIAGKLLLPDNLPRLASAAVGTVVNPTDAQYAAAGLSKPTEALNLGDIKPQYNKWKLLKSLGGGAFGKVFLAWDGKGFAAIKLQQRAGDLGADIAVQRTSTEFAIQSVLGGAGISPRVYAIMEDDPTYMIAVTEVMNGGSLTSFLATRTLTDLQKRFMILQLATKLFKMHELGFAHRDIKPDNILVDAARGEAFFGDLGEATIIVDGLQSTCYRGDPFIGVPEQFVDIVPLWPRDQRKIDDYGFGRVIFYIFSGQEHGGDRNTAPVQLLTLSCGGIKAGLYFYPKDHPSAYAGYDVIPNDCKLAVHFLLHPNWVTRWSMRTLLQSDCLKPVAGKS